MYFEQGSPHFHFALGFANYVTDPDWVKRMEEESIEGESFDDQNWRLKGEIQTYRAHFSFFEELKTIQITMKNLFYRKDFLFVYKEVRDKAQVPADRNKAQVGDSWEQRQSMYTRAQNHRQETWVEDPVL